jgi:hypothetical protein
MPILTIYRPGSFGPFLECRFGQSQHRRQTSHEGARPTYRESRFLAVIGDNDTYLPGFQILMGYLSLEASASCRPGCLESQEGGRTQIRLTVFPNFSVSVVLIHISESDILNSDI